MQKSKYVKGLSRYITYPSLVGIILLAFILSNFLLFYLLFESQQRSQAKATQAPNFPAAYLKALHQYYKLIDGEWRISSLPGRSKSENVAEDKDYNCSALESTNDFEFIATGWTKATYKLSINGNVVALKTVNLNGYDISHCVSSGTGSQFECNTIAATNILVEIVRLKALAHRNIIKVLGYCVPDKPDFEDRKRSIGVITEYGESMDVIRLLQMSWEDRLRICLGIARLLHHLSKTSLGPVAVNDFRRQQFVVVEGEIKLVDVDDIGTADPFCENRPCCVPAKTSARFSVCAPCVDHVCRGYNEKANVISAGKHFINYILPHGAPAKLNQLINTTVEAYDKALWTAAQLFHKTEHLMDIFKRGLYRDVQVVSYLIGYKVFQKTDSESFNYRCKFTTSGSGCTLSVYNEDEAAFICSSDPDCKAFVFTNTTTWTGRRIVHFKNGVGSLTPSLNSTLYVKI